ncbi:MAG: universal stress protein [Trueperaceae bacterium]|nr:universal stress protein [Trueperaceae bacterium]
MARRNALLPLDGSKVSQAAVHHAQKLLEAGQDHITLIRVWPVPNELSGRTLQPLDFESARLLSHKVKWDETTRRHPIHDSENWDDLEKELSGVLHESMEGLEQAGFNVSLTVRFGKPAEEIAAASEREHLDLIIMATHGRTGVRRALMGSVAEGVLREAGVPVLMVRASEDA